MKTIVAKLALLTLFFSSLAMVAGTCSVKLPILCVTPTVSIVSSPTAICAGTTASLTASGAASYSWNTSATTTVLVVSPTVTTTYTVTGFDGAGCSSTTTLQLFVDAPPSPASAGPSQALCVISPFILLNANVPAVGTGSWSILSGVGTILNTSAPSTTVTSFMTGMTVFQWIISNGVCPSSISTVTVMVDPMSAVAIAGPTQTLCIASPSTTMNGNAPAAGTGTWSILAGSGVISNINSAVTPVMGLAAGTTIFQWMFSGGACPSSVSTMTIFVDQLPTQSIAGLSQTVCGNTATLSGNMPFVGTGLWTLSSGTAVISNSNLPVTGLTGLGAGPNVFVWSIANGVCPTSTSTVSVIANLLPSPSFAGASQTLCVTSPSAALSGNVPAVGTGTWSILSGIGTIANITAASTTVTGLALGSNVLQWSISNGTCPPSLSTLTVVVDAFPTTALAGPSQTVCGGTATLSGNAPTLGMGLWTSLVGSASIFMPNSPVTGLSNLNPGITVFQWSISNGVCAASTSTMSVTCKITPTVTAASSSSVICLGASANLTAGGANNYTWNTSATTSVILVSPMVSTTYTVTGSNGPCSSLATVTQFVSTCTGMEAVAQGEGNVMVYPNPFSEELQLQANETVSAVIFNSLGQQLTFMEADGSTQVSTRNWDKGMYYVQVKGKAWSRMFKVIKN